ncbi:pirin family protein [Hymenobacter elongatus]|uniref:Pirin family protein n=1 Tax=Hymenobacter elongatus TaxID=877208 RepID=A0A4Z0PJU1_9BACT|nr:pirin-like C-terminal cupin domain-containing protein [Hymenobacter elongatus]TGE15194.1 pirin family protein [Hymenobacter elongatus]
MRVQPPTTDFHAEVSSSEFKKNGGGLEILQLWLNLPARLKMTEPRYVDLQQPDIPSLPLDEGCVMVNLIAGAWEGQQPAFKTLSEVTLSTIFFRAGGELTIPVPAAHNIFFCVVRGALTVNGQAAEALHLVEFHNDGDSLHIQAGAADAVLLFGHAQPFDEPVVAQGPFVMNTEAEIQQAYDDYRRGKFGQWQH